MLKKSNWEKEKEFEERMKAAKEIVKHLNDPDPEFLEFWEKMQPAPKTYRSKNLDQKIIKYRILIHHVVCWNSRQAYLNLLKKFLGNEIGGITFQYEFGQLRVQDMLKAEEICDIIEEGQKPIPDFYYTSKSDDFSSATDDIYSAIDLYDSDLEDSDWNEFSYSESKLRSVLQENYVPIFQKCCDLENSFFQPKIDLD